MSEYLKLKAQIEELQAKLETVRRAEMEAEVADMRKRIAAFGIEPSMLYPDLPARGLGRPARVRDGRVLPKRPTRYKWNGHEWAGPPGPTPQWYKDALAAGISESQMRAPQ